MRCKSAVASGAHIGKVDRVKDKTAKSFSRLVAIALAGVLCAGSFALVGCSAPTEEPLTGIHHASVSVKGFDPFTIELDADEAPITVTNFVKLADAGYYDGLTFYRIQDDFCIQGGTKGNNAAGNDPALDPIKGEFSLNGVENKLADDFKRGTVAMARTQAPDSATSTFFITLSNSYVASLNGSYAAFGTIDDAGMKIVDAIVSRYGLFADQADMGVIADEADQPIITSITIMD